MRTGAEDMRQAAVSALTAACNHAALHARAAGDVNDTIVEIEGVGVRVRPRAVAAALQRPSQPTVVVADQVGEPTRRALRRAGVGWLDRRGHLYLPMLSPVVDRDVPPSARLRATEATGVDPFGRGRATIEVALDLLMAPGHPTGVRQLAREVGLSPASISLARQRLQEAFLVTADHRGLTPELFEALGKAWRPRWLPLSQNPNQGVDGIAGPLVRTGDTAAARLGAPIAVGRSAPSFYYVATPQQVQMAVDRFPADIPGATSWVALAPARLIITRAGAGSPAPAPHAHAEPLAPAVVVGLELFADPGRGTEILANWRLPEGSPWRTR